jgi:hypothetical protein
MGAALTLGAPPSGTRIVVSGGQASVQPQACSRPSLTLSEPMRRIKQSAIR